MKLNQKAATAHSQHGFSLIELMVVLTIIGLLAGVAYPSYRDHVARSKRADAQTGILEVAQYMQRYYAANNSFASATVPTAMAQTPKSGNAAYNLGVVSDATTFTITATPTGSMTNDKCGRLTLTDAGVKGVNNGTAAVTDCWR